MATCHLESPIPGQSLYIEERQSQCAQVLFCFASTCTHLLAWLSMAGRQQVSHRIRCCQCGLAAWLSAQLPMVCIACCMQRHGNALA